MKRVRVILLFLFISFEAFSQRAVVALPKMSVAYIGLDNPIQVAIDGVKAKDLIVEINGGELKGENGNYIFIPDGSVRLAKLKVGVKKRNKIKWVDSSYFRIRKVPNPEVLFGTKTGGEISYGEIMTVSQINAGLGECFAFEGLRYTIKSYRITLIGETVFYTEQVKGNRITGTTKEFLKKMKGGDKIFIDRVEAIKQNQKYLLLPIEFKIKGKSIPANYVYKVTFLDSSMKRISYDISNQSIKDDLPDVLNYKKDGLWQIINIKTGKPVHESYYRMDTLMWIKVYFQDGSIKFNKTFNHRDSTGTYSEYYANGSFYTKGDFLIKKHFNLKIDDSCFMLNFINRDIFCDMGNINECLIGKWVVYYPNGKIKEEGIMDTLNYTDRPHIDVHIPGVEVDRSSYRMHLSVRHGIWKFYDEKGKLIQQTVYDKGHIKE